MKKTGLLKSLKLILLYIILNIFLGAFNNSLGIDDQNLLMLLSILESFIILVVYIFGFRNELKNQFSDFKENFKSYIIVGLKFWFIGFLLMMFSNLIINLCITNGIAPNEEMNRMTLLKYPIYSIISMCIITPFVEELLFRLNFKDVFKKKWIYVSLSGFIFAFMHVILSLNNPIDFIYLIPYSSLGMAFGLIYYNTQNIYTSIMMHSFHNILTVTIIFLGI